MKNSTTNESGDGEATPAKATSVKGVLCAKCNHLNEQGGSTCRRCKSHLYITCVDCGHRNQRVHSRCTSCDRRLHRSFFAKIKKRFTKANRLTPLQIFLFFIAIAVCFLLLKAASHMNLPSFN